MHRKFEQLVQKIYPQSRLLRVWELKGGISAEMTALEIARPNGQTKKMVVRQHSKAHFKRNPQLVAHEFRLLQIAQSIGLVTPTPYHLDESGEIFSTPYAVIEYIEGETEFAPQNLADYMLQLAVHLSRIHRVDGSNPKLSFLRKQTERYSKKFSKRPEKLDESIGEGRIRAVLESAWPWPQRNKPVLLHGDFWPGNVLWKGGRLAAIIDWEYAALGDPLEDLANSRLEVLWAFGSDAMHDFTRHYQSMVTLDFTDLSYWDLCAAIRPAFEIAEYAEDAAAEKRMRERHGLFVAQAFEKLSIE